MQVRGDDGTVLDAEYQVQPDGQHLALIMESRSGVSGSRPPRNPDYNPALSVLLARLANLGAVLVDALVDSQHTRALLATGINAGGHREILGLQVTSA